MNKESFKKSNANSLIKQMRRGIFILRADDDYPIDPALYTIIDINSSAKNFLGKKYQNLVGQKITDSISLTKDNLDILAFVMNTGQSKQFEYYVKHLDEWLLISIHHSQNNYLTVIFENITKKKKTDQMLIDSEETMRLTLEVTGEGVWEWGANDTVKHNKQWCNILGLDEKYLTHHVDAYVERIHPDDRNMVLKQLDTAIKTQEIFHHQYRMIRADGEVIWVEDRGRAVVNSDGEFERMIGSLNEITHITKTQVRLNLEKELLKSTLLSVSDGIVATDVNGNITIMNPVAEEFSGWNAAEVLEKNITEVINMVDSETNKSIYCFHTADSPENMHKQVLNKQVNFTSRHGEEYVMNCSISPIRLSNEKLSGFVVIFRDVTDIAEYQKEIEYMSYHDDLTGLYNRRFMRRELKHLDKESQYPLTVMAMDLNNLKQMNDYYGHMRGDRLIQRFAHVLKDFFTQGELISRIGGDEFLLFLPNTSEEEAGYIQEELLAEMQTHKLGDIVLTAAIGYATKNEAHEDIAEIFKQADNDMYKNKRLMKNNQIAER